METRGGNGYIEEWVNARLVRDSHIGVLWEGTSNINAIDVVRRAVGKANAHKALYALLQKQVAQLTMLPEVFRNRLLKVVDKSFQFISSVAAAPQGEHMARQATTAFYNAASAVVLAWESTQAHGDPRKLLISRFVLEHRLEPMDPLTPPDGDWEVEAYAMLLDNTKVVSLADAVALIAH
jgi:acyl-CoA dehydrogenase